MVWIILNYLFILIVSTTSIINSVETIKCEKYVLRSDSLEQRCKSKLVKSSLFYIPTIYEILYPTTDNYEHWIGILSLCMSDAKCNSKVLMKITNNNSNVIKLLNHPIMNPIFNQTTNYQDGRFILNDTQQSYHVIDRSLDYDILRVSLIRAFWDNNLPITLPMNLRIVDIIDKKEIAQSILDIYNPSDMQFYSHPFNRILAIAKLNSLKGTRLPDSHNISQYFRVLNNLRYFEYVFVNELEESVSDGNNRSIKEGTFRFWFTLEMGKESIPKQLPPFYVYYKNGTLLKILWQHPVFNKIFKSKKKMQKLYLSRLSMDNKSNQLLSNDLLHPASESFLILPLFTWSEFIYVFCSSQLVVIKFAGLSGNRMASVVLTLTAENTMLFSTNIREVEENASHFFKNDFQHFKVQIIRITLEPLRGNEVINITSTYEELIMSNEIGEEEIQSGYIYAISFQPLSAKYLQELVSSNQDSVEYFFDILLEHEFYLFQIYPRTKKKENINF